LCTTPCPKHQAVLAMHAADVAVPTAVVSAPAATAKAILSAPISGPVVGAPALVAKKAKKAKASKESALAPASSETLLWIGLNWKHKPYKFRTKGLIGKLDCVDLLTGGESLCQTTGKLDCFK
jgi:hypothetical protein